MPSETLLTVKNLKKYFPIHEGFFKKKSGDVKAVDDVSFTLQKGEVLGIVGESGSGKSTVARLVCRLMRPTSGQIIFLNRDLFQVSHQELNQLRREMQIVFQDPFSSLNPRQTIGDAIGEPLSYHGLVKNKREERFQVIEVLEQVGLSEAVYNRYPHEFSGGQQQRICIGRALALKPQLIICDEAVSSLDISVRAQILNLLQDLKKEFNLSYLFISHDLSVVRYFSDKVLVMYHGKVVEEGDTEEVFKNPKELYTKTLIESIPRMYPCLAFIFLILL
jgi:peptide/nickel transport system ATP-binding protein/oligopeptide transport system ATP-binding protein